MSSVPSPFQVNVYGSSLQVPENVLDAMRNNQPSANCTLPILLKSRSFESSGKTPPNQQVWVVCSSKNSMGDVVVELVIAITEGYIDSYPAFFFSAIPPHLLAREFVQPRMEKMIQALFIVLPVRRVYAVYGPDLLAKAFAWCWTSLTGVGNYSTKPYYAAKLSFCTRQTFKTRLLPLREDLTAEIRPADPNDIMEVAQCCYGFASDSDPYNLTEQGAIREAEFLVHQGQIWIHRVTRKGTGQSAIASIVAFTRISETNGTITKVYTNPNWRRLGCAERLVRQVCEL
ncbi:hypothetical protein AN958_00164 [Leucoagaricus sp. SymC.cos]|nr:hypothetical protein AN958_00164 [Leucoagaricus sp. SymC.cos]